MKFNLKNRPSKHGLDPVEYAIKIEEWCEGFEKELRELDLINFEPTRSLIKEVLGE